jgi:hypothetical protein
LKGLVNLICFEQENALMLGISSLKKLVTDSMAIDMGTASTIIAVKGRDIVLDEPSMIAVNELTGEIVAYGQEAFDMRGREGRDITVVAPFRAAWSPISSARKKCSRILSKNQNPAARRFRCKP